MPFATSNVKPFSAGNFKVLAGDWTGVAGDSPGDVKVGGGRVYFAFFYDGSGVTPVSVPFPFYVTAPSGTTTTSTVTVNYTKTVNNGRFVIFYA